MFTKQVYMNTCILSLKFVDLGNVYTWIHVYNYLYVNTHVCVKYLFRIYLYTEDDFMSSYFFLLTYLRNI